MAYELRRPIFDLSGSLAAAVASTDAQITGRGSLFTGLPADYSQALYLPLVLANDGLGKSEIVWATGHASASPTLTVVRGREGTTPTSFDAGDVVRCSPTLRDAMIAVATRADLPADAHYGLRVLILDEAQVVERTSGGWNDSAPHEADTARKHHWVQTGVTVPNGSTLATVSGLAAAGNHSGTIGQLANGVFTPRRAGHWVFTWQVSYTAVNSTGVYYQQMSWADGAFPLGGAKGQTAHHLPSSGIRGNTILSVEWSGYVNPAQATKGITLQTLQSNDGGGSITGAQFDFTAEFMGA